MCQITADYWEECQHRKCTFHSTCSAGIDVGGTTFCWELYGRNPLINEHIPNRWHPGTCGRCVDADREMLQQTNMVIKMIKKSGEVCDEELSELADQFFAISPEAHEKIVLTAMQGILSRELHHHIRNLYPTFSGDPSTMRDVMSWFILSRHRLDIEAQKAKEALATFPEEELPLCIYKRMWDNSALNDILADALGELERLHSMLDHWEHSMQALERWSAQIIAQQHLTTADNTARNQWLSTYLSVDDLLFRTISVDSDLGASPTRLL